MSEIPTNHQAAREPSGGGVAAAISNGMVGLLRRHAGRGPTRARTTVGRDHVLVMLRDTLTTGEHTLVAADRSDLVLETRRAYQEAMRPEAIAMVENLTGRRVVGFMSDNHIDPDLAAEVFVLEPDGKPTGLSEGDADA